MKKRAYKQSCALALASDLLGERWTLLIFRELLIQPCRFKQLNLWLEGMGTNLLTSRLKELEMAELVEKQNSLDKRSAYQLTGKGLTAEPLVLAFIRWGLNHLRGEPDYLHFPHWDLLAMKALFNAHKNSSDIILQFSTTNFLAWTSVSEAGFHFAMGRHPLANVEIPTDISQFHQDIIAGQYSDVKIIQDFIACFEV